MEPGFFIIVRPGVGMVRDKDLSSGPEIQNASIPFPKPFRKAMQEAGFLHKEGSEKSAVHCPALAAV